MSKIYYALGLHMHQPPGNLKLLIENNAWEAQQIIRCYERAARYALMYKDSACFHVDFSGILLEQFLDPAMVEAYKQFVDIPAMLANYRKAKNIEIIGMGFFHPIFPLIPKEDWAEQLCMGSEIVEKIFGQKPMGFWPSEMAFSMEMIPALKEAGYQYVIVDHVHVRPKDSSQKLDTFKLYIARHGGAEIVIIPRNRDLSNAQESGLDPAWFLNEVHKKMKERPNPKDDALVTSWSDGENGGWFRQMDDAAGFFGHFFAPLMDMVKSREAKITPIKISEYLKTHPAKEEVIVNTGAWNVGSTSGYDFRQWNGSGSQKKAIDALFHSSRRYWELKQTKLSLAKAKDLVKARRLILDAETSCYLFWGDAWIPKIYDKLDAVNALLR